MSEEEKQIKKFREKFIRNDGNGYESFWEVEAEPEELEQFMRQAFKAIREEKEKNDKIVQITAKSEYGGFYALMKSGKVLNYNPDGSVSEIKNLTLSTDKENI